MKWERLAIMRTTYKRIFQSFAMKLPFPIGRDPFLQLMGGARNRWQIANDFKSTRMQRCSSDATTIKQPKVYFLY